MIDYILDALARAFAHECVDVASPSGLYRARSCVTRVDGNVVFYVGKLYDTHSGQLLARTDFDSVDSRLPEFLPDESAVIFRRGEGDGSGTGFINIPPNWLERIKAKIP
ncbi:hypothetical protein F4827_002142 [Paraburkholderia bannensis]|uniref:Uncharacterized protein n=1 Tax=Paraburkholderia bannensis TaxID=765414 RepID=A0A7W9TVQ5_9BURK|nr:MULTISPECIES: hypothetical protein [Paraburkholderia]MBB3257311.1 hypothetical protein [Paraburkholderia sp. WP4_3_2]MBB6102293.1 hypothetical protein [Paraburkholderia bannensis]